MKGAVTTIHNFGFLDLEDKTELTNEDKIEEFQIINNRKVKVINTDKEDINDKEY